MTAARPGATLAVLASRVRYEEKRIFAALERREVHYTHLDPRRLTAPVTGGPHTGPPGGGPGGEPFTAALNREISHSRALLRRAAAGVARRARPQLRRGHRDLR